MSIDMPERPELEAIAKLASESGEKHPLTANDVAVILQSYRQLHEGDEVGSLLRNPDTGALAHRVSENGLHLWRCSAPDGSQWNDTQPTLDGWEKIG